MIILVLVTVLLAAFLLTKFVQRAGTEMLADARAGGQATLRREAYSALEVTLAVLADVRAIDNGLHSPAQGWDRPLDYAGYVPGDGRTVEVAFEDESGKISLPRADFVAMEGLLELLGLEQNLAEQVSDAMLVWIRPDYVPVSLEAGAGSYERAVIPYDPAQRPLRAFSELAAVDVAREVFFDELGRPTALAQQFEANVSLYSFDRINLNAAPSPVLAASGLAADQIDALKERERREKLSGGLGYYRSVGDASAVLGGNAQLQGFGAEVRALRINVTVRDGAAVYRLSAVVAPPGGASLAKATAPDTPAPAGATQESAAPVIKKLDYPFKVLEIREDVASTADLTADAPAHD